jgi:hypothetical protein
MLNKEQVKKILARLPLHLDLQKNPEGIQEEALDMLFEFRRGYNSSLNDVIAAIERMEGKE